MAKDPAFLFYPNDYIGGTMGMTFEEKGAYIELLMLQFNRGHMTKHMIGQTVGQIWDNISDKFSVDSNGLYFNERLESEQNKRKSYSESRRNNKNGTNQYSKKKVGHMTSHMENVNEDVNEDVINNKGVVKLSDRIPSIESFIAYGLEKASANKMNVSERALRMKFEAWKENGWVNGNGKEIRNWKPSLLNTLPHIQETEKGKPKEYESQEDREARIFMENLKKESINQILYDVQPDLNNNEPADAGGVQRISERPTGDESDKIDQ